MAESGLRYDDILADVRQHFGTGVSVSEQVLAHIGGRFLSRLTLSALMDAAIEQVVEESSDTALLAVLSNRPDLLHVEPKLYGPIPTPRKAMEHALKTSIREDLRDFAFVRLGEGQDADTLPETAGAALKALAEIEAGGTRYREGAGIRRVFGEGDWENPIVYGVGIMLADFLLASGRKGVANDLRAAIEARETVMAMSSGPSPR